MGASEYTTIKTSTAQKVGKPGQNVAEKTLLGWTIRSPGGKDAGSPVLLTQSAFTDYEQPCSLDVLGLADTQERPAFGVQRIQRTAGWYDTKLPWKGNHPTVASNKAGSK